LGEKQELLLEIIFRVKCHDMVADQTAAKFNVTWSRTTPIVVSVLDDAYEGYMTLECDHRMGMDVIGDAQNIKAFRFACSMAINPVEHWVMKTLFPSTNSSYEGNSELYSSITIGLGQKILNGEMVDIFMSNGYLVIKSQDNTLFLVFDPVTGIVRDVMVTNSTFSYSSWCYSDQQTEWASDLGNDLLSKPLVWLGIVSSSAVGSAEVFGTTGVLELGAPGTLMIEGGAVVSMAVSVAVMVYYPYFFLYEMPEKLRILKEMNDMAANQTPLWIGTVSLFLPDDREPTPEELQETYWQSTYLLMAIAESDDTELLNDLFSKKDWKEIKKILSGEKAREIRQEAEEKSRDVEFGMDIPPDDRLMRFLGFFVNKIREGYGKLGDGDYVGGMRDIAIGTSGIDVVVGSWILYEYWPDWLYPKGDFPWPN